MNGLTLRINPSEKKKTKNLINFVPVNFELSQTGSQNELFVQFLNAASVDQQLKILKKIFDGNTREFDTETLQFLALAFLQAEVKHPVKCFIARRITRNEAIEEPFSVELSSYIKLCVQSKNEDYQSYINIVSKIFTCIENFPAGSAAIKKADVDLAEYLKCCLRSCRSILSKSSALSPTEKNEIYSLAHVSLRMQLYIIQKVNPTSEIKLRATFDCLRNTIKFILFDEDAPIDTKSISGILCLSMMLLEFGSQSWIKILDCSNNDSYIDGLLCNESAKLALYSAIATVVPVEQLQAMKTREKTALIYLTECIIEIGERNSSESIFTLGVTRAIVQLSKLLELVSERDVGDELMLQLAASVWPLLDHYMDSVRHLAAQALKCILRHCTKLEHAGDAEPLSRLMEEIFGLDKSRRSYHVALGSLAQLLPISRLLPALPTTCLLPAHCPLPAATATLEILLEKHARKSNPRALYEHWVVPILRQAEDDSLDSVVLAALEHLLTRVVALDENIVDYIFPRVKGASVSGTGGGSLKCILMLLSVARRAGVVSRLGERAEGRWKGVVSYAVLRAAAVDAVDETRLLTLALVVDSPKSTEAFSAGELELVVWFLRHNVNTQAPHFRQRMLALLDKFLKRIENSHKVLARQTDPSGDGDKGDYYVKFVERLRRQCFLWLVPAANYSRRLVALQLLLWCDTLRLRTEWEWGEEYMDKVLWHLDDSYEGNKLLALELACRAPPHLLQGKSYRVSLDPDTIIQQASSLKPTECVSASYKLLLLVRRLPHVIVKDDHSCGNVAASFILVQRLIREATQMWMGSGGCAGEGARSPSYGLLHCARRLLAEVAPALGQSNLVPGVEDWKKLVKEAIEICVRLSTSVEGVVSRDAPEGSLPSLPLYEPALGNVDMVQLSNGAAVTAQMVLLAAWRAVKEASLLLGTITSSLPIEGEGEGEGEDGGGGLGLVTPRQVGEVGEHLGGLLSRTQHRGAFEQVYVAFTQLLARLWRCRQRDLHSLPQRWARRLHARVARPKGSATRRSAGLPFLMQALVTTELQVLGNPRCLHECMTTLLKLAQRGRSSPPDAAASRNPQEYGRESLIEKSILGDYCEDNDGSESESLSKDSLVESRTHSMNILRTLFRNSALEESVSGYVEEGLMVALSGFEGDTWMERNSATLLFSALVSRVFGPYRPARPDRRLTARGLAQHMPKLHHFLLKRLDAASSHAEQRADDCTLPAFVFLSRLSPAGGHGGARGGRGGGACASGTTLLASRVRDRARATALSVRRLAAHALVPLVAADAYLTHIESMFSAIQDPGIKRNHCHGVLLQLTKLLSRKPDGLVVPRDCAERISQRARDSCWILKQAMSRMPCYLVLDEYIKMINMAVWRFPTLIDQDMLDTILSYSKKIICAVDSPPITLGRETCLANVMYICIVILQQNGRTEDIARLILDGLKHPTYEVVLSTLNYMLILHNNLETDCKFQQHLLMNRNEEVLSSLRKDKQYLSGLCTVVKSKYLECAQKSLTILSLEEGTQKNIISTKFDLKSEDLTDEDIVKRLFHCMRVEHENLTHIYLRSLSKFISLKLAGESLSSALTLEVVREVYACSSSDNSEDTRSEVVGFLESNLGMLLGATLESLTKMERFELKATVISSTVRMLEDDDETVRHRASCAVCAFCAGGSVGTPRTRGSLGATLTPRTAVPSLAASLLRDYVCEGELAIPILVVLALLDFKSEVCITDELSDQCRVFDQNERYNIFLEESMWTSECADLILDLSEGRDAAAMVKDTISNPVFADTIHRLCNDNLLVFMKLINDNSYKQSEVVNPKVELFVRKLSVR